MEVVKAARGGVKLTVDTRVAQIGQVVSQVMARYSVLDMTVEDPPMEEVIAHIYGSRDD